MVQTREPVPGRMPPGDQRRPRPGEAPEASAAGASGVRLLADLVNAWAAVLDDTPPGATPPGATSHGATSHGATPHGRPAAADGDGWPGTRPEQEWSEALPDLATEALLLGPYGGRVWPWPAELGARLLAAHRAGCRVRVLSGHDMARPHAARLAPDLDAAGAQVRAVPVPLPPLLLVDAAVAVVPRPRHDSAVLMLRDPGVVGLLYRVAEVLWSDAVPVARPGPTREPDDAVPSGELRRRILRLLAEGAKDETIARTLGISVRTCRRHIAEILADLGAVSRFQAGVNAGQLGLLPPGGLRVRRGPARTAWSGTRDPAGVPNRRAS